MTHILIYPWMMTLIYTKNVAQTSYLFPDHKNFQMKWRSWLYLRRLWLDQALIRLAVRGFFHDYVIYILIPSDEYWFFIFNQMIHYQTTWIYKPRFSLYYIVKMIVEVIKITWGMKDLFSTIIDITLTTKRVYLSLSVSMLALDDNLNRYWFIFCLSEDNIYWYNER